jgi:tetratricopeptide (TPR) repeat protein
MNNKYEVLLTKLQNADESEREWLVMEFSLDNSTEILRQAVWAAAIPHWFDADYLNAVLGFSLQEQDFKALINLSYVEVFPERGFNVHERSRKLLLDQLASSNKKRLQKLSKRAVSYCKKQDQENSVWRVETLYQQLLAGFKNAEQQFIDQGVDWNDNWQYEKLERLARTILDAVNGELLTGDTAGYAHNFQAKVDIIFCQYNSAKKHSKLALTQRIQRKILKANCYLDLGRTFFHLGKNSLAYKHYTQALSIYRQLKNRLGEANCIFGLAETYEPLSNSDSLKQKLCNQALVIYQEIKNRVGEANCIQRLADIDYALADYPSARAFYQQALLIYQQIKNRLGEANCIKGLGDIDKALADYPSARASYQQALLIYQQIQHRLGEERCIKALEKIKG